MSRGLAFDREVDLSVYLRFGTVVRRSRILKLCELAMPETNRSPSARPTLRRGPLSDRITADLHGLSPFMAACRKLGLVGGPILDESDPREACRSAGEMSKAMIAVENAVDTYKGGSPENHPKHQHATEALEVFYRVLGSDRHPFCRELQKSASFLSRALAASAQGHQIQARALLESAVVAVHEAFKSESGERLLWSNSF